MKKNINENIRLLKYNYLPLQPGFEIKCENYMEMKLDKTDALSKTISVFYQFKVTESVENFIPVIPDGCVDIIFYCSPDNSFSNICGSVIKSKKISFLYGCEYFGVRFFPGEAIRVLKCSIKEFIDNEIPLIDIVKKDLFISEKICKAENFYDRIAVFKNFITSFLLDTHIPIIIQNSINRICENKGLVSISELAEYTGYSTRYLRKTFETFVGISPKLLSQIVRFQNCLYMIINGGNYHVMDTILECGYYDQSHFINEFKKFTYLTPNQIKLKNF